MLHDNQIRPILFDYLEMHNEKIRILEEKVIRSSRADVVAIVDGEIWGLEIKSDFDSYARLAGQVKDYDKFYTRNFVVVGRTHKESVVQHVPPYWGILSVDEMPIDPVIELVRPAQINPKMRVSNQVALLWKSEMHRILLRDYHRKYVGRSRAFLQKAILEKVSEKRLPLTITTELFERDYSVFQNHESEDD